jgi:hypothetical protein
MTISHSWQARPWVLITHVGGGCFFAFVVLVLNEVHTPCLIEDAVRIVFIWEQTQVVIAILQASHIDVVTTLSCDVAASFAQKVH